MLSGSPVGVATAPKRKTPSIVQRHERLIALALRIPTRLRPTMKTGTRNPIPKTIMVRIRNDR